MPSVAFGMAAAGVSFTDLQDSNTFTVARDVVSLSGQLLEEHHLLLVPKYLPLDRRHPLSGGSHPWVVR